MLNKKWNRSKKSNGANKKWKREMPPGMIAFRELVSGIKKHVSLPGVIAVNILAKMYIEKVASKDSSLDSVAKAKKALQMFEADVKSRAHKSDVDKALKVAEEKAKNKKPRKSKKSKKADKLLE